jgi:ATP-dependent protease ClpP protease subunit
MERVHRWTNLAPALVRQGVRAVVENDTTPEIWVYDYIDSWGGDWGVSAADVIDALASIGDVPALNLRINSPGGDYFEGVAIYNALVRHTASVTVHVDALAASAASVIAMSGDRIIMGQGAQMMIHEARSSIFGATAAEMLGAAAMLEQTNSDIAGFYAQRAGGDVEQWRAAVAAETWYTATQAVEAGLADEIAAPPARQDALAALLQATAGQAEIRTPDVRTPENETPAVEADAPSPTALPTAGTLPTLSELISSALHREAVA